MNLLQFDLIPLDNIQLKISKIYGITYLLDLGGLIGVLFLYKIDQEEQTRLVMTIRFKPGGYSLRIQDNLIILHNYGPQETLIFDIKNNSKADQCFIIVKHQGAIDSRFNCYQVQYLSEIDPNFPAVDKYYYLNNIDRKLLILKVDPLFLIEQYPDSLESILFLLRRKNKYLKDALFLLKKCLERKICIHKLVNFFQAINKIYKETAMLRNNNRNFDPREILKIKENNCKKKKIENSSENQLKSKSGITILLQSDMYISVFKPFYKNIKDYPYLSNVLISYIQSLVAQELHVHISHQHLLVKILLKLENYQLIRYLLQYQIITNHLDIAMLLTRLNENHQKMYPELFNSGIDMLYQLKQFSSLVKTFTEKGDFFDALTVVTSYEDKYDLDHLINASIDTLYEEIVKETLQNHEIKHI